LEEFRDSGGRLLAVFICGETVMKKSIISTVSLGAIFCAGLMLQSCSDTRTETYESGPYAYETRGPYAYESGPYAYETPVETSSTTTYTTTTTTTDDDHDSVVGSTAHAAGTIIAAPFRLVGDALGIIF
jgi:hypothetical protein